MPARFSFFGTMVALVLCMHGTVSAHFLAGALIFQLIVVVVSPGALLFSSSDALDAWVHLPI